MNRHINVITSTNNQNIWSIQADGYYRRNVERQMLKDDMSQDAVDNVFNNAARILQHCPNPYAVENNSKTGIVIREPFKNMPASSGIFSIQRHQLS